MNQELPKGLIDTMREHASNLDRIWEPIIKGANVENEISTPEPVKEQACSEPPCSVGEAKSMETNLADVPAIATQVFIGEVENDLKAGLMACQDKVDALGKTEVAVA